jgi:predicted RNA-binding Zn ribbon-like protein
VHFNPYGGQAAEVAATLVNLSPGTPPYSIAEILRALDYRPLATLNSDEAKELLTWADQLRPVFGGDRDDQVNVANELLSLTASQPFISRHDGRAPHLHFAAVTAPIVERLKAYTAAGLAHAICQDGDRLGRCRRPGCGLVFVDTSRNGRRRFCSARCANRVHVADHRGRQTLH